MNNTVVNSENSKNYIAKKIFAKKELYPIQIYLFNLDKIIELNSKLAINNHDNTVVNSENSFYLKKTSIQTHRLIHAKS